MRMTAFDHVRDDGYVTVAEIGGVDGSILRETLAGDVGEIKGVLYFDLI